MPAPGESADTKNNMEHGPAGKHGAPFWQEFALFLRLALFLDWHSMLQSLSHAPRTGDPFRKRVTRFGILAL